MPDLQHREAGTPETPLREIPGSELVVLEGTGHFVVDDAPERYAEEVVRFLTYARPDRAR